MANSTATTDGADGTAAQYNAVRLDALQTYMYLEKLGAVVQANAVHQIIVPEAATIKRLRIKCESGSGVIRIKCGATTIKGSMTIDTTGSTTTSFDNTALTAGEFLILDITSATNLVGVHVTAVAERT
jgi:regulator of extracellular matrix RemA (YlzA/DUF370 family)